MIHLRAPGPVPGRAPSAPAAMPEHAEAPPRACDVCGEASDGAVFACESCGAPLPPTLSGLRLGSAEWTTLVLAPLHVFFAVAGADGDVDGSEVVALRRIDGGSLGVDDPLFMEVARVIASDLWGVVALRESDGRGTDEGLRDAASVLDRVVGGPGATAFRLALLRFGLSVSRASGGFLGFGDRVHKEERRALRSVASLLGVEDGAVEGLGIGPGAGPTSGT